MEIVQGYYISLLSATPAKSLSEERSWLYTMYAFGVAAELGLDQPSRFRHYQADIIEKDTPHEQDSSFQSQRQLTGAAHADSNLPYPSTVNYNTEEQAYNERLARNKERTWLRILLWERANSAACGRINAFPETELTCNIESWWMHPLAEPTDKHTCAFILLRRHLASLQSEIRRQGAFSHSEPHWVREIINTTFDPWRKTWLSSPRRALVQSDSLPNLYLYYVYVHGRLWILSSALNASLNGGRDLDIIREDCFEAAVHCCEIAVRDLQSIGEPMYCMLSPTWAMISYAAVLALKLFPYLHGSRPGYEVELLALLAQVALQLKRAGSTPSHRLGIAALLGEHLLMILRTKAAGLGVVAPPSNTQPALLPSNSKESYSSRADGNMWTNPSMMDVPDPHVPHPMVSTYDPFLTTATLGTEADLMDEGFEDLLREIFGPGFGDVY